MRNANLEALTNFAGEMIPGRAKQYFSADNIDNRHGYGLGYPVVLLNRISRAASLADHRIYLKKRCVGMLLQKLQPKNEHVYGARYIVESMTEKIIFLRVATGNNKSDRLYLPQVLCNSGDDDFPITGFHCT